MASRFLDGMVGRLLRHEHGRNFCIDPAAASRSFKIVVSSVLRVDRAWPKGYFSLIWTAGYVLDSGATEFRRIDPQHRNSLFNLTEDEAERLDLKYGGEY